MQHVAPIPAVSVLMPVHNGAAYVDEAIESVVRQTCVDWELIVVDDGSTDDTPEKLAAWARRDARVIVLSPGRLGLVGASNAAVNAARGRYLARLDSDDIAAPTRLARQLAYMDRRPEVVVLGGGIRLFGERSGWLFPPLTDWGCRGRLLFENCFAHSTVMIRRDSVRASMPLYEASSEFAEDLALWLKLASCGRYANMPRVLASYRVHQRQISRDKAQLLRQKHARFAVAQWAKWGVSVAPEAFMRFRWPEVERGARWQVARDSFSVVGAMLPLFCSRFAPIAAMWVLSVLLRNAIKMALPAARSIL